MKSSLCQPEITSTEKTCSRVPPQCGYLTIDAEGEIKQWGSDNSIYLSFKPDIPHDILCTLTSAAIDQTGSLLTICWAGGGVAVVNILTHEIVLRFNMEACIRVLRDMPALDCKIGEDVRCCRTQTTYLGYSALAFGPLVLLFKHGTEPEIDSFN